MAKTLTVEIIGDASSLQKAFGQSAKAAEGWGSKVSKASKVAGVALIGGLAVAAKIGFGELAEAQKVTAQTEAALKSTGGAANVTGKQIESLAGSLSAMSGVDDELIQSGSNLILTFKNVRNEVGKGNQVFNRATAAAVDLSVAGFGSVESSSKMLGKALNDPIKGLSALGRAGVTFTEAQKNQIKAMVESGNVLGAQKLILRELESQVGGSAKAYGNTLPGQLAKAKNAFSEMAAQLVGALLPALTGLAQIGARVSGFLMEHQTATKIAAVAVGALGVALFTVGVAMKAYAAGAAIVTAAQWAMNAAMAANPFVLIVAGLVALGIALVVAYQKSETFRDIVNGAFNAIKAVAEPVIEFFKTEIPAAWDKIKTATETVWSAVSGFVEAAFGVFKFLASNFTLPGLIIKHWDTIKAATQTAWNLIESYVVDPIQRAVAAVKTAVGAVRSAVETAWGVVQTTTETVWGAVKKAIGTAITTILEAIDKYLAGVQFMVEAATKIPGIGDKFEGLADDVKGARTRVTELQLSISGLKDKTIRVAVLGLDIALAQAQALAATLSSFGGASASVGTAPVRGMATGGIVTRPTLALVGERGPEAVIPLGAMGGGIGDTYNIEINGVIGSKQDVVEFITRELQRQKKRGGPGID